MDHLYDGIDEWKQSVGEFEMRYLGLKNTLNQRGKEIKTLEFINHSNRSEYAGGGEITGPRYIGAKHVWIEWLEFNPQMHLSYDCYPGLKIISFEFVVEMDYDFSIPLRTIVDNDHDKQLEIETIRFVGFHIHVRPLPVCCNQKLIESLNLHNSLKNLTLWLDWTTERNDQLRWLAVIKSVLNKEYFFNLENVNILFDFWDVRRDEMTDLFNLFKEQVQKLKHQFQQLKIGFRAKKRQLTTPSNFMHYVLEWNENVDEKYLDQQYSRICTNDNFAKNMTREMEKEFYSLICQWVPQDKRVFYNYRETAVSRGQTRYQLLL